MNHRNNGSVNVDVDVVSVVNGIEGTSISRANAHSRQNGYIHDNFDRDRLQEKALRKQQEQREQLIQKRRNENRKNEGKIDLEELNQAKMLDGILSETSRTGVDIEYEDDEEDELAKLDLTNVPFSTNKIPWVKNVKLVFGNLTNAYRYRNRDKIYTRLDLPRIFPRDVKEWKKSIKTKTKVCVFTRTPRQDSLWRTNILSMFASGEYNYAIMRSTLCQHEGTCSSPEMARTHPECDPETMPTIHLLERIKNFQHERFEQVLTNGINYYDVLVATGDEFCRAKGTFNRAHFRNYWGPLVTNSSMRTPIYIPLGPREEFERVLPREVRLVKERRYLFNFLGSLTSMARRSLVRILRSPKLKASGKNFVHVVSKWSKKLTKMNGYVPPPQYKQVLLNSIFTLAPQGHSPEAFRIFEACEAGSIPIVVIDHHYRKHECKGSYMPLIRQGAPFVFLNSWQELPLFMEYISKDHKRLQQMQADVMAWYAEFMRKVATQFESILELRFHDRVDRGEYTSTAHLASLQAYLDDPKYVKSLT